MITAHHKCHDIYDSVSLYISSDVLNTLDELPHVKREIISLLLLEACRMTFHINTIMRTVSNHKNLKSIKPSNFIPNWPYNPHVI